MTLDQLRDLLRSTLAPLVEGHRTCALVDFPDHSNVGDSAIWLGARSWLSDAGLRISYRCAADNYSRKHLERCVPAGPIFINGGGNLGDLWRQHQRLREAIITDFKHRPIVQLPQTVHFQRADYFAAARQLFDAHPNLTLLVRDRLSFDLVRSELRATSALCPDMAFYIGQLDRVRQPDVDILWLRREDRETSGAAGPVPSDVLVCDWLDEQIPMLRRARNVLRPLAAREPRSSSVLARALAVPMTSRRVSACAQAAGCFRAARWVSRIACTRTSSSCCSGFRTCCSTTATARCAAFSRDLDRRRAPGALGDVTVGGHRDRAVVVEAMMVSLVISTRNPHPRLAELFARLAQLEPPAAGWELILVDNGSTDGTPEAIRAFAAAAPCAVRCVHAATPGLSPMLAMPDSVTPPDASWHSPTTTAIRSRTTCARSWTCSSAINLACSADGWCSTTRPMHGSG